MNKVAGSFTANVTMQHVSGAIPDVGGHELSLVKLEGPQTSADPLWNGATITYWGFADLVAGNGTLRGYWLTHQANGDAWGTFEGKVATSAGGQFTMDGAYKATGGTGPFKGLAGHGKYKGQSTSPTTVTNDWSGEYQVAASR